MNLLRSTLLVLACIASAPAAACEDARWGVCVGWPAEGAAYRQKDPEVAATGNEAGLSPGEQMQHWRQEAEGNDDTAVRALIELGQQEARRRRSRASNRHYGRALQLVTEDSDLRRRLHWSRAQSCAELGDFPCAREHWLKAGALSDGHPAWLPAAYAYGLWQLGENQQAIAWYVQAVHANPYLGRGTGAGQVAIGTPLNEVSRKLFSAWAAIHAPTLTTVLVEIGIAQDGRVERVRLVESELEQRLATRVQAAIAGWRFEPPLHEGRRVALGTHAYVDVRGRTNDDGTASFEVQYVRSGALPKPGGQHALRYPKEALDRLRQGRVDVRASIRPDGTVERAEVVHSSGHQELDAEARRGVSTWTFLPESVNGVSLPGSIIVPFEFRLEDGGETNLPLLYHQATRARAIQTFTPLAF